VVSYDIKAWNKVNSVVIFMIDCERSSNFQEQELTHLNFLQIKMNLPKYLRLIFSIKLTSKTYHNCPQITCSSINNIYYLSHLIISTFTTFQYILQYIGERFMMNLFLECIKLNYYIILWPFYRQSHLIFLHIR
jgi:hypothetical protein